MHRLSSSLRERPVDETLRLAERLGRDLGVVRVTDTTRLDCLGVPVFASIRPAAVPRSLCVGAGKGLSPAEAKIGAYMEAIELALAEPNRAGLEVVRATGRDLIASSGYSLLDFCPSAELELDEDRPIDCTFAVDLDTQRRVLVPADRVFFPCDGWYYAADTNGLASGNSLVEATVHALCEVIERDICSFQLVDDTSRRVRDDTLPAPLAALVGRVAERGFAVSTRVAANAFGLPYFRASVHEIARRDSSLHVGYGCHPWAAIAATRAVCEAFQCRLSVIHGGRDDLLALHGILEMPDDQRNAMVVAFAERSAADPAPLDWSEVGDRSGEVTSFEQAYRVARDGLRAAGAGTPMRVAFTPPEAPLQVVKVVVPGLEFISSRNRRRMGVRMRRAIAARRASARKVGV